MRLEPAAEALEREAIDLGLRLSHAHERRIHDHLEQLVDVGQLRPPQGLPLAHVVGQQGGAKAAPAQVANQVDHRLVAMQVVHKDAAEGLEIDAPAELRLEHLHVAALADRSLLELEQRVAAVGAGQALHRRADLLGRDAAAFSVRGQGATQRRRQHAAEVRDHGPDHAATGSSRVVSS